MHDVHKKQQESQPKTFLLKQAPGTVLGVIFLGLVAVPSMIFWLNQVLQKSGD